MDPAFRRIDICVTPVLAPDEVRYDPQMRTRLSPDAPDCIPAIPRFSRTPVTPPATDIEGRTEHVLAAVGLSAAEIRSASPPAERRRDGGLSWPPNFTH